MTGEAFTAGAGRFARVVYAATETQPVDTDLDVVGRSMATAMADTPWTVLRSTQGNIVHLGMPEGIDR